MPVSRTMLFAAGLLLTLGTRSQAALIELTPNPVDLGDLEHSTAYSWGIATPSLEGSVIVGAELRIDNLRNWIPDPAATLHVQLLGSAPVGVTEHWDNRDGNYFAGYGIHLTTFTDLPPYDEDGMLTGASVDLRYTLSASQLDALLAMGADGAFGLGFDPDCHFYNDGVSLVLNTAPAPVPEPGTLALLGIGLLGAGLVRLRKKSA